MTRAPGRVELHAYQIRLRRPETHAALFAAIARLQGVSDAQLMAYDGSQEA